MIWLKPANQKGTYKFRVLMSEAKEDSRKDKKESLGEIWFDQKTQKWIIKPTGTHKDVSFEADSLEDARDICVKEARL